jgi:sensor c-di-GMP phosphodiesterase-like protein
MAMDDFGTGYSSLALLMQFSVDTLKIDTSFFTGLSADSPTFQILEVTIALAKVFACAAVAEGIETERQADIPQRLGCGAGQGLLFAPPLSAEIFLDRWLTSSA